MLQQLTRVHLLAAMEKTEKHATPVSSTQCFSNMVFRSDIAGVFIAWSPRGCHGWFAWLASLVPCSRFSRLLLLLEAVSAPLAWPTLVGEQSGTPLIVTPNIRKPLHITTAAATPPPTILPPASNHRDSSRGAYESMPGSRSPSGNVSLLVMAPLLPDTLLQLPELQLTYRRLDPPTQPLSILYTI